MDNGNKRKALLYILAFSLFWAIDIIIGKYLLSQGLKPFSLLLQGYFWVLVLVGFYLLFHKKKFLTIKKKSIPWLLSIGIAGSGLGIGISYLGLNLSTSINYGFIIKTSAVFTVIIANFWFHDEKIDIQKTILSVFFMVGAYLVATNGQLIVPNVGDILIFGGAVCLGVSNNMIKVLVRYGVDNFVIIFFRILSALVLTFFFALILKNEIITLQYIPIIFADSLMVVFLLYCLNKTIEYSSPSYASMMSMIVPVIVIIFGVLFLKEKLQMFQIIGGTIIIISGVLLEKYRIKSIKN
jgi:drug/metabolite transporter (DMT)-like permease